MVVKETRQTVKWFSKCKIPELSEVHSPLVHRLIKKKEKKVILKQMFDLIPLEG